MHPQAEIVAAEYLRVGLTAHFERDIEEADVLAFAHNSGDFNPLHVDAEYARETNFSGRIVHGAFQIGLASALIGMQLPGRDVLLGSIHARFLSPLFYPCRVIVAGEMRAWNPAAQAGSVRVVVREAASHAPVSEITLVFTVQGARNQLKTPAPRQSLSDIDPKLKLILLTGASGGIGSALLTSLTQQFGILALVRNHSAAQTIGSLQNLAELHCDLSVPGWEQKVSDHIGDRALYAIIHCAWPGMPRGGLLNSDPQLLEQQLAFGTSHLVRLASLLFQRAGADGGRLIALGSSTGRCRPNIGVGVYSLAKAAMEDTVKLLAPELARRKITANAVCPSYVMAGMNAQATDLQGKRESALIPMGRLCELQDVVGAVRYLLSPDASFVSGQSIVLSGAQL